MSCSLAAPAIALVAVRHRARAVERGQAEIAAAVRASLPQRDGIESRHQASPPAASDAARAGFSSGTPEPAFLATTGGSAPTTGSVAMATRPPSPVSWRERAELGPDEIGDLVGPDLDVGRRIADEEGVWRDGDVSSTGAGSVTSIGPDRTVRCGAIRRREWGRPGSALEKCTLLFAAADHPRSPAADDWPVPEPRPLASADPGRVPRRGARSVARGTLEADHADTSAARASLYRAPDLCSAVCTPSALRAQARRCAVCMYLVGAPCIRAQVAPAHVLCSTRAFIRRSPGRPDRRPRGRPGTPQ